jgi:hypothetical protein
MLVYCERLKTASLRRSIFSQALPEVELARTAGVGQVLAV